MHLRAATPLAHACKSDIHCVFYILNLTVADVTHCFHFKTMPLCSDQQPPPSHPPKYKAWGHQEVAQVTVGVWAQIIKRHERKVMLETMLDNNAKPSKGVGRNFSRGGLSEAPGEGSPAIFQFPGGGLNPDFWSFQWSK